MARARCGNRERSRASFDTLSNEPSLSDAQGYGCSAARWRFVLAVQQYSDDHECGGNHERDPADDPQCKEERILSPLSLLKGQRIKQDGLTLPWVKLLTQPDTGLCA